jgi:thiol-disulfide isomerase/thioredoxin
MKKYLLLTGLSFLTSLVSAQSKLTIIEQDYELARKTAAAQHKLLIIDFYTTWCVPCKALDKKIFQNDSIAGAIGKNFVVLKYDAEKDAVHNLSLKHHIASYPTTMVLQTDGRVIRKMYGSGGDGDLVIHYQELLQESLRLNRNGTVLSGIAPTIDTNLYPVFYKNYVRGIANIKPADLPDFWKTVTDLKAELSFDILAYFGRAPKKVVDYFLQNKAVYETLYGKADVKFVLNNLIGEAFSAAVRTKTPAAYTAAKKLAATHLSAGEAARYETAYELDMQVALGNWSQAADLVEKQLQLQTISGNGVNAFCWTVFETCSDSTVIGRAIRMMKNLTDREPQFATLDTYARLLAKQGDKERARTAMKQAIELGKAGGEDTSDSENALRTF